jgi:hypothetical protein
MAELGPALFILLLAGVFPMLDLIFAGVGYCAGYMLSDLELREAARLPKSQLEAALVQICYEWRSSGIGQFAGVVGDPQADFGYYTDNKGAGPPLNYVTVTTIVQIKPLLPIPFIPGVPALSVPATYTFNGRRILENAKFAFE